MHEIKCPHCGKVFTVDESGYAELVKQVRDAEFAHEVQERERLLNEAHENALRAAEERVRREGAKTLSERAADLQKQIAQRDEQLVALRADLARQNDAAELARATAARDEAEKSAKELGELRAQLAERSAQLEALEKGAAERLAAAERELKVQREAAERELSAQKAAAKLELEALERGTAERIAAAERELKIQREAAERELAAHVDASRRELAALQDSSEKDRELAVTKATADSEKRIVELEAQVERAEVERSQAEESYKARLAEQLALKDQQLHDREAEIERVRNMRAQLSTKLIGETLEQHCETEFNKLRATAFRGVEFHKDNDVVDGSKGDYVYREKDDQGVELISIMFEMKNEEVGSTHHHKNADFFKKLDRDRRNKKCEYAVLVSLLEPDNEFYNGGIADVSYYADYCEKMYVIRPQFFIPLITILRNAAGNALAARRELAETRQQNIDVTHFEEKMEAFKTGFGKNYEAARAKYKAAIDEIDKTIDHLEKVKENLMSSERQLKYANDKAEGLTIRKLTYKNPTMREKFEEARALRAEEAEAAGIAAAEDGAEAEEADVVELPE